MFVVRMKIVMLFRRRSNVLAFIHWAGSTLLPRRRDGYMIFDFFPFSHSVVTRASRRMNDTNVFAQQKLTHSCIFTSYFTSEYATLLQRHWNWSCAIGNTNTATELERKSARALLIRCDGDKQKLNLCCWFGVCSVCLCSQWIYRWHRERF